MDRDLQALINQTIFENEELKKDKHNLELKVRGLQKSLARAWFYALEDIIDDMEKDLAFREELRPLVEKIVEFEHSKIKVERCFL